MSTVASAVRRDDTILHLGGDGDNWLMTWLADDTQLTGLCDGSHLSGTPRDRLYNSHLYRVLGSPPDVTFRDVPGYPDVLLNILDRPAGPVSRYYGFGVVAVDGVVYQFMSTFGSAELRSPVDLTSFVGVKIIYSSDNGATWCNADGSTPVSFPARGEQSRDNLTFFHEPDETFALITALQMGQDYGDNTDGYVYLYAPNGVLDGTMNELALLRVPTNKVLDRSAYEYFVSRNTGGSAQWSSSIAARGSVHTFPLGWVNRYAHPYAWHPSVVYNAPLDVYLMANWGMGTANDGGDWFAKPTYLGLWTAPEPWGPWTQILEEPSWTPSGDQGARCYQPQISPKWIAADGKSFWLVWTDFQSPDVDLGEAIGDVSRTAASEAEWIERVMPFRPGYSFSLQRVDLVLE